MLKNADFPIVLLYNPDSGRSNRSGESADTPPSWLEEATSYIRVMTGRDPILAPVGGFEETIQSTKDAAANGAALIIAAGGDGTLRAVAEGLVGGDIPMGILPRGTANVLARELKIPLDNVTEALAICLTGETRRIDVGFRDDQCFLVMCSLGFDAQAVGSVNKQLKEAVGGAAYVASAVGVLSSFNPPQVTITLDDKQVISVPAFMVVIANAANYGGDILLTPEAELEDGLFDVGIFIAPDLLLPLQHAAFLRQIGAVALGVQQDDPDIRYFRAKKVTVTTDTKTAVQLDGDPAGETPITVEIRPQALPVRMPHGLK